METLAWLLLWVMVFGGGYWAFLRMGKTALTRHLSEQTPVPDPKTLLAEARRLKEAEKAQWMKEFQEILRKTCKHRYNGNQWKDWWKCLDCGYEQEWEYSGGCACRSALDRVLTDATGTHVLLERSRACTIHGRTIVVEAAKETERVYSKGGYLGLHNDK